MKTLMISLLFTLSALLLGGNLVKNVTNPSVIIDYVDVGQGDAMVIRDLKSEKVIVIDAGKRDGKVIRFLEKKGVKKIDLFIFTHPHSDHIGSAKDFFDKFEVLRVLDSGYAHTSRMYKRLLEAIKENKIPYILAKSGQNIKLGTDRKIRVLAPGKELFEGTRSDANANSIILQLIVGNTRFYFAADSEEETEEFVLEHHSGLQSDVLKIAHHGSKHATTDPFLKAVSPTVAIIPVAKRNVYHHPSPETMSKLKFNHIKTYQTSINGTITVKTDGKKYSVHVEKNDDSSVVANNSIEQDLKRLKETDPDNYKDAVATVHTDKTKKSQSSQDGKMNLNTATSEELQTLKGIGPKTAEKIIRYRTENGSFSSIHDITDVKGIGEKTFEKLKNKLFVK